VGVLASQLSQQDAWLGQLEGSGPGRDVTLGTPAQRDDRVEDAVVPEYPQAFTLATGQIEVLDQQWQAIGGPGVQAAHQVAAVLTGASERENLALQKPRAIAEPNVGGPQHGRAIRHHEGLPLPDQGGARPHLDGHLPTGPAGAPVGDGTDRLDDLEPATRCHDDVDADAVAGQQHHLRPHQGDLRPDRRRRQDTGSEHVPA